MRRRGTAPNRPGAAASHLARHPTASVGRVVGQRWGRRQLPSMGIARLHPRGAPSCEQERGFSPGLEARLLGWPWARHPGPAEAALALRLLPPAAWDGSPGASESPAAPPGPGHLGGRAPQQHLPLFLAHPSAQRRGRCCSAFCKGRAARGTSMGGDIHGEGQPALSRVPKSDSRTLRIPSRARCWLTPI